MPCTDKPRHVSGKACCCFGFGDLFIANMKTQAVSAVLFRARKPFQRTQGLIVVQQYAMAYPADPGARVLVLYPSKAVSVLICCPLHLCHRACQKLCSPKHEQRPRPRFDQAVAAGGNVARHTSLLRTSPQAAGQQDCCGIQQCRRACLGVRACAAGLHLQQLCDIGGSRRTHSSSRVYICAQLPHHGRRGLLTCLNVH